MTAADVFQHLVSVRAAVRGEVRQSLAPLGMRPDNYAIACVVFYGGGGCGNAEVAEALGLPRGSTHRLLKELQAEGLIQSDPDPTDKRFNRWNVTEKGQEVLSELSLFPYGGTYWQALLTLAPEVRRGLFDDLEQLATATMSAQGSRLLSAALRGLRDVSARTSASFTPALGVQIYLLVMVVYRLARGDQTRHLQEQTGGTVETAHYMAMFKALEPCSVSDMAEFLRLDTATTTRVVDHLVRLGYLNRQRKETDGRQVVLSSTRSARELVGTVAPFSADSDYTLGSARLAERGHRLVSALAQFDEALSGRRGLPLYGELLEGLSKSAEAPRATVPAEEYRTAISEFATGVAVLSAGLGERRRAITVNSVTSLSLRPPLLMVSLIDALPMLELVTHAGRFTINVLAAHQRDLAVRFGSKESPEFPHDFTDLDWYEVDGAPAVKGSLVSIICRVDQMLDIGDHTVIIGAPIAVGPVSEEDEPLTFWRGRLGSAGSS